MSGSAPRPPVPAIPAMPAIPAIPAIPDHVLAEVYAHAAAGHPEEVCGLLISDRETGAVTSARRCENRQNALHAEDPAHFPRDARTAYNLGAQDLFFLDRSLRSPHPVTIIYHSHVEVGAYFSAEDKLAAAPDGELPYQSPETPTRPLPLGTA